jgi:sugar lactone lactonase YvrE
MTRLALASFFVFVAAACSDEDPPCDTTIVGNICTLAGDGENGYEGDDGPATSAKMSLPQDVLHDVTDNATYILDWNNHRVRKLPGDGTIRHVAGRGELGGTLDDPANSDLNHPTGLTIDPSGKLLIAAWHNSMLRTVDLATGDIANACGDGRRAYFGDDGPALGASLDLPASIAYAPNGDLIIMDQANQVLRAVDASGTIRRIAGNCVIDGPQPVGPGPCPPGVDPTPCPPPSNKTTCGVPESCAAPCTPGYGGDDGPAIDMRIAQPFGQSADPAGRIAFDAAGNLYFADTTNALIRKIDTNGIVTRVAGTAPVGGMPQYGYEGDGGPATSAKLHNPVDLAIDGDGTIYFTDVYNHCIRKIAPDGTIATAVGRCGTSGYDGDGGPALEATLRRSYGLELAGDILYIADTGNHAIRAVRLR